MRSPDRGNRGASVALAIAIAIAIASDAGFGSLAHFNRQFLRVKGMTPTAFRHQRRG